MNEHQIEQTLSELKKSSRFSLVLVLLGAAFVIGSLLYASTRLSPLEQQIATKSQEIQRLAETEADYLQRIEQAKAEYASLKDNIEQLYAVKVTSENKVYEIKATAKATGQMIGNSPAYNFSVFVNTSDQTLDTIKQVTYNLDHPTFPDPIQTSFDRSNRFAIGYTGWGCLRRVPIKVELKNGQTYDFDFDMCKSLGPQWGATPARPSKN